MIYYIYDGTFEGFLTAIQAAFHAEERPEKIIPGENYQPSFFAEIEEIESCPEKAERVQEGIKEELSSKSYRLIHHAFLSELENIEICIYDYLRLAFITERKVEENWQDESVKRVKDAAGKVRRERHRFKGLLRFRELKDGTLYGPYGPDYNITGLLVPHFANRLATEQGIIHDRKRDIAAIFSQGNWEVLDSSEIAAPESREYARREDDYQQLWQSFFDSIGIEGRKNPELQQSLMPKKYWQFLIEKPRS